MTAYRAYLQPGRREDISALLTRLRGHYFVPNMSPALAQALADDWADDMEGFPLWAVKAACDRYRRNEENKIPKPAAVMGFARDEIQDEARELDSIMLALSSKPGTSEPPPRVTPEEAKAIIDRAGLREDMDRISAERERGA